MIFLGTTKGIRWSLSPKKIRAVLRGGLGNQLLQIVALKTISEITGREIALDTESYHTPGQIALGRKIEVYVFFDKKFRVTSSPKWLPIRVVSALRLLLKFFGDKSPELVSKLGIFAGEKSDFTHLEVKEFGRAWYVDSYFTGLGDKKVFGKYLDEVTGTIESLITNGATECHFAVHVRMGDYLKIDPALIPSPSRYKIAIESLVEKGFKTLVIFSDQPAEALDMVRKMNLGIEIEVAKEDLSGIGLLASLASFNAIVCSSSTLSWWAARVVERRQGAVYFPDPEINGIPNLVLPKTWMLF